MDIDTIIKILLQLVAIVVAFLVTCFGFAVCLKYGPRLVEWFMGII